MRPAALVAWLAVLAATTAAPSLPTAQEVAGNLTVGVFARFPDDVPAPVLRRLHEDMPNTFGPAGELSEAVRLDGVIRCDRQWTIHFSFPYGPVGSGPLIITYQVSEDGASATRTGNMACDTVPLTELPTF